MINSAGPADFLRAVEPGTRVVARHRVPGGFTDALGYLRTCDGDVCEIDTRRGTVVVPLANVVAAKQVPEPPGAPHRVTRPRIRPGPSQPVHHGRSGTAASPLSPGLTPSTWTS